ncbi:40S ribosomal protein S16-1 [Bienertia sinuspersici]
MPLNQQAISQNVHSKWTEKVLDGSLRLLNICGTSRDVLVQSKEGLQDIQSVLRRRCSGELNITNEIVQYLNTRKSSKKMIKKSLKNIKETEQTTTDKAIESMLKDVESVTSDAFKSVLVYIGSAKSESQKSIWSLVNKLIHQGSNTEAKATNSKFDAAEATLEPIIKNKNGIIDFNPMLFQVVKLKHLKPLLVLDKHRVEFSRTLNQTTHTEHQIRLYMLRLLINLPSKLLIYQFKYCKTTRILEQIECVPKKDGSRRTGAKQNSVIVVKDIRLPCSISEMMEQKLINSI